MEHNYYIVGKLYELENGWYDLIENNNLKCYDKVLKSIRIEDKITAMYLGKEPYVKEDSCVLPFLFETNIIFVVLDYPKFLGFR